MPGSIYIGTRGSRLALWQANWVKTALESRDPSRSVELIVIKTTGDKILNAPLATVGGKGLFVKEIEAALLGGRIDMAVHSMKDMPSDIPAGLCVGAVPQREVVEDVLISKNGRRLAELKAGARIGTGSLRRAAQLKHARPDVLVMPLRGNLDTRLRKLDTEDLDAVVLAAAGIKRLGFESRVSEYLNESIMLPAVGQGALCIETRAEDAEIAGCVGALDHPETRAAVMGERAFLNRLEGSCQVPVAGLGRWDGGRYLLQGLVADIAGDTVIRDSLSGNLSESEKIGVALADRLLARGAKEILDTLKADADEG